MERSASAASPSATRPGLRAADADRDAAIDRLRVAAGEGRLAPGELEQRVEAALGARELGGELAPLLADLPGAAPRRSASPLDAGPSPVWVALLVLAVVLVAVWAATGAGYFWPAWAIGGTALWIKKARRGSCHPAARRRAPGTAT